MAKKKTIDEATGLLTWLIAETAATRIMVEKFEDKLGKGNIKNEHSAELEADIKNWQKYLIERAEGCFKGSKSFNKAISSNKGNQGRDTLYSFMYHWMGVCDERVWEGCQGTKTKYAIADLELKRYLETGEIR